MGQKALLYTTITWKFNLDGASWWGGFWVRLVGMVKSCLLKSIGNGKLSFTKLLIVLFKVENVLNNRPLCFVYDDDVSDIVAPDYLFYGRNFDRKNKVVEETDFGVNQGSDMWDRKCALQNVVEYFWSVLHREYLDGLRKQCCKKFGRGAAVIKVGDVVVIGEDVVPKHRWKLGILVELIQSIDWFARGAKVKVGKTRNVIRRPVNCLYPTEVHATEQLYCNISWNYNTNKNSM